MKYTFKNLPENIYKSLDGNAYEPVNVNRLFCMIYEQIPSHIHIRIAVDVDTLLKKLKKKYNAKYENGTLIEYLAYEPKDGSSTMRTYLAILNDNLVMECTERAQYLIYGC